MQRPADGRSGAHRRRAVPQRLAEPRSGLGAADRAAADAIPDRGQAAQRKRARCHRLSADISSLADIDLIVERADGELVPQLLAHLEAARAALEAIHGV